jgi:hypothetical protein
MNWKVINEYLRWMGVIMLIAGVFAFMLLVLF